MKKISESLKKFSFHKLWMLPFVFILTWIIYLCILDSKDHPFNPILLILFILLFIFLCCSLYKKLYKKFNKLNNKKTFIFFGIMSAIMVLLQFFIGYKTRTNPTWDLGITIEAAKEIIQYGHMTDMAGYFVNFPNNIFNAVVLTILFKVFSIFGFHAGNGPMLVLNIFLIQLALYFMFQISRRLFGNFAACFTYTLSFLFIPFYPYSSICYTDTMSMFIPVAFVYVFIKIKDNKTLSKSWYYYVILGLLIFLSLKLKVTAIIMFIALIIVLLFSGKFFSRGIKYTLISILIILVSFLGLDRSYTAIIDHSKILNVKYSETGVIPYTHWIMMGTYDMGAFSSSEYQYTLSYPDYESRKKANIEKIKERLSNWKTQGYIKFLNYKISTQTWGSGTYDFEEILPSNASDINYIHEFFLIDGKYYNYIYYFCQTYHFSMLILILISLIYSLTKKENSEVTAMKLAMFGLFIFLLIWETRARYMLNYIPIYILLMVSGINWLFKDYKKILNKIFVEKGV